MRILLIACLCLPLTWGLSYAGQGLGQDYLSSDFTDAYKAFATEEGSDPSVEETRERYVAKNPHGFIYQIDPAAIARAVQDGRIPILLEVLPQDLVARLSVMTGENFAPLKGLYMAEYLSDEAHFRAYDTALKKQQLQGK